MRPPQRRRLPRAGERRDGTVGHRHAAAGRRRTGEKGADADGEHRGARRRPWRDPAQRRRDRVHLRVADGSAIASRSPGDSCSGSAQTTRASRARTCSSPPSRPSGNEHVALLAAQIPAQQVSVGADREQLGCDRARCGRRSAPVRRLPRRWCAARRCRRVRPASSRCRSVRPRAASSPAAIGITSVVVPPQSTSIGVGQRASDQQRGRDPVGGGAAQRLRARTVRVEIELAVGRDHPQRVVLAAPAAPRQARAQHPGSLAREARRPAPRSSSAPPAHPRRSSRTRATRPAIVVGQSLRGSPQLERLGGGPDPAVGVDDSRLRVGAADVETDHGLGGRWESADDNPGDADRAGARPQGRRRRSRAAAASATLRAAASPLVDGRRAGRRRPGAVRAVGLAAALRRRPRRARRRAADLETLAAVVGGRRAMGRRGRRRRRTGGGAWRRPARRATWSAPSR